MPAPVTKLSDRFADYTLRIRCRKCGHVRETKPHALAKLLGWEALVNIESISDCDRCLVARVSVTALERFNGAPRACLIVTLQIE